MLPKVRALPGVADAVGEVRRSWSPTSPTSSAATASAVARQGLGRGIDPTKLKLAGTNRGAYGPLELETGAWANGRTEVVVDRRTAARSTTSWATRSSSRRSAPGTRSSSRHGLVRFEDLPPGPSVAVWDIQSAQNLFDREGRFDVMAIDAKPGTSGAQLERGDPPLLPRQPPGQSQKAAFDEAAGRLG